jgi:hypothetical protein
VAWYPSLYAPRAGGAYDSHHSLRTCPTNGQLAPCGIAAPTRHLPWAWAAVAKPKTNAASVMVSAASPKRLSIMSSSLCPAGFWCSSRKIISARIYDASWTRLEWRRWSDIRKAFARVASRVKPANDRLGSKAVRLRREKDDVGFCQIGKEAICFAARFNAAMRRQSDLVA